MQTISKIVILSLIAVIIIALALQSEHNKYDDSALIDKINRLEDRLKIRIEDRIRYAKKNAEYQKKLATNDVLSMVLEHFGLKLERIEPTSGLWKFKEEPHDPDRISPKPKSSNPKK